VKTNTVRRSTAAPLYRLAFDDVVSGLLKVKAPPVADTTPRPTVRPIRPALHSRGAAERHGRPAARRWRSRCAGCGGGTQATPWYAWKVLWSWRH